MREILRMNDFSPTREIVWSTKFDAPGVSGWQQIAMTAITFAPAVVQQADKENYASRGEWSSAFSENDRLLANLTNYQNFMNKRYSSTKQSGNIVYVLTDLKNGKDKGAGVVGVNLYKR